MDESGYSLWTKRTQGRALKGQPAVRVCSGQRGKNLSLILAISPQLGLLNSEFIHGSVTREIFKSYLDNLCSSLAPNDRCLIIVDNASVHKNISLSNSMHTLKFLPPYSPMLKPIEECFSIWKSQVKAELALPDTVSRVNDSSAAQAMGANMQEYRLGILKQVGQTALGCITNQKIINFYLHSMSFFPKCQNKEDV